MAQTHHPIASLLGTIDRLGKAEEIGAVLVHMNDTYLIEEQRSNGRLDLPGMARVGALITEIRDRVSVATGSDRTLVLHSGDFLSPSYLANRCGTEGRAMLELMDAIGTDFVTLGNHEFDHDDKGSAEVLSRLLEGPERRFGLLSANLDAPDGFPPLDTLALWPTDTPFMALVGLAGADTMKVAAKHGFGVRPWEDAMDEALAALAERADIPNLLALTHLDRDEDHALQDRLRKAWSGTGHAHIFGGHDHHMYWLEPPPGCTLSKNLSNCGTVTVSILTNTILGAPSRDWGMPQSAPMTAEEEIAFVDNEIRLKEVQEARETLARFNNPADSEDANAAFDAFLRRSAEHKLANPPVEGWEEQRRSIFAAEIERAATFYSEKAQGRRGSTQRSAFLRHLREVGRHATDLIGDGPLAGRRVFERARDFALEDAQVGRQGDERHGPVDKLFWTLEGPDFEAVAPLPPLTAEVARWMALQEAQIAETHGGSAAEVIVDFTGAGRVPDAEEVPLQARDVFLRVASTDFGNLVADAVALGTGAEAALIHAGSFRLDRRIGPRITLADLLGCFIYDDPRAVLVTDFTGDEIAAMLEHARGKFGSGAFLQVSGAAASASGPEPVRTAVAAYLLTSPSDQDGYQAVLAELRGMDREAWAARDFTAVPGYSLIDLCRTQLALVVYDTEERLAARETSDAHGAWVKRFIAAVDVYAAEAENAGYDLAERAQILAVPQYHLDEIDAAGPAFEDALEAVLTCTDELLVRDFDDLTDHVERYYAVDSRLVRHERRYTERRHYSVYLSKAFEYVVQRRIRASRQGSGG